MAVIIVTADIILNVYTPNNIPNIEINDSRIGPNTSIDIVNKSDTIDIKETNKRYNTIYVSAKTGNGMEELMNTIRQTIHELFDNTESELTINARTKTLLESARDELSHALTAGENYDIFAEHARRAADCIGKILGTITANDVLDMTFGQLCLGK